MGTISSERTYAVAGMTCEHCVHSVTDEVTKQRTERAFVITKRQRLRRFQPLR